MHAARLRRSLASQVLAVKVTTCVASRPSIRHAHVSLKWVLEVLIATRRALKEEIGTHDVRVQTRAGQRSA